MQLTTSDLVVLSVLLSGPPMHGYELVKRLDKADFEDWAPISRPQVYYSLRKLAKSRYLQVVDDQGPASGPERIVYKPSMKAAHAVQTALDGAKWVENRPPTPFLTWCGLALLATPDTIKHQIKRRKIFLKREIAREQATLAALSTGDSPDGAIARVMVTTVIKQFQVEVASLPDLRRALLKNQK